MVSGGENSLGVILADAAYHLSELKTRFGIGEWAIRKMRRAGLPVRRLGRRSWVLGRDLLTFIETNGKLIK